MKFYIKENDKIQLDQILKAAKIMDDYVIIRKEIADGKVSVNCETKLNTNFLVKVGDQVAYKNFHIKVISNVMRETMEKEADGNIKHGKRQKWLVFQDSEMTLQRNEALELSKSLQKLLIEKKKTIAFAESCTGGLLQELVTFHAGASAYFYGGIVCYSDEMKIKLLQIPLKMLKEYGAVSKETAELMMQNVRKLVKSDIGISITGIAGPDGGTIEKPVGTVFLAIGNEFHTENYHLQLDGKRESIRLQTAIHVLKKIIFFVKRMQF
jgi:PncC family amidohydrolase